MNTLSVSNITEEGAIFSADLYALGSEAIKEYGFVWGTSSNPGLGNDKIILQGAPEGIGIFTAEVRSTLVEGTRYTVKSFVRTENFLVWGKTVDFVSLGSGAPEITGFYPVSGLWGDTITITGKNFSWVANGNKVLVGDIIVNPLLKVSDTLIYFQLPNTVITKKNLVSVEIAGNKATCINDTLTLVLPELIEFFPTSAYWGDTLSLTFKNLLEFPSGIIIGSERQQPAKPLMNGTARIIVSYALTELINPVRIDINNFHIIPAESFTLLPPAIDSIAPASGNWSTGITLYGHFNTILSSTSVLMGDLSATISSISKDSVRIKMPSSYKTPSGRLTYKFKSFTAISSQNFTIDPPEIISFTPLSGYPGQTVTIRGKNFSPSSTQISFNSAVATNVSVNDSVVVCKVPSGIANPVKVSVTAGIQTTICTQDFTIVPPEIISFTPSSGYAGQTVTIKGKNFPPSSTQVRFNSVVATNVSVIDSVIVCKIPSGITNPVKISVTNGVQSVEAAGSFTVLIPSITSFSPLMATPGDTIIINGENLNSSMNFYVYDYYNNIRNLDCFSYSGSVVKAVLPGISFTGGKIFGRILDNTFSSASELLTPYPEIYSISPSSGTAGQEITITGSHFSRVPSYNRIWFEYCDADIISSTATEVKFLIPYLPVGPQEFAYGVSGYQIVSPFKLTITDSPWKRLPYISFRLVTIMDFGTDIYAIGSENYNTYLWKFNVSSSTFSRIKTFSESPWLSTTSVVKGRDSYMFTDISECKMLKFNADAATYSQVSTYPGPKQYQLILLDGDSVLYAGGGTNFARTTFSRQFWKYNPATNKWRRLGDLPGNTCSSNEFRINGKCYVLTNDKNLYEYNPATDSWIRRASTPEPWYLSRAVAICSGKVYIGYGAGNYNQISFYDPLSDTWSSLEHEIPGGREFPLIFEHNDKIYLGAGRNNDWMGDFWEYDPSKDN